MEWVLLLGAVGGSVVGARSWVVRRRERRRAAEELDEVRRLADEDVTLLGEQLSRLDDEVAGRALDEATRVDYQRALDAYESAQRLVPRLTDAEEVSKVTDVLASGRYALACVQARVAGRPVPELRVPCFFNPAHGPSVRDVLWTRPGRGTRTVPACAQDATRIARGERPDLRIVRVGGQELPYWHAGAAFLPYSKGYFATALLEVGNRGISSGEIGGGWGSP